MRVISGTKKGKALQAVPGKETRPTTDRVKESVFNIIGPYFDGENILDLFAGSGGLGIEALSRGAGYAVFIDNAGLAIQIIRKNLQETQLLNQADIYRADWKTACDKLALQSKQFDYVFLDPPYLAFRDQFFDILHTLLDKQLLSPNATIVYEHDSKHQLDESSEKNSEIIGRFTVNRYKYGTIGISVLRNKEEA